LAVANFGSNNVSTLLGDGAGAFGTPTDFAVGTNPFSVAIKDLNGDGKPDLAVANFGSNTVSILLNTTQLGPSVTFDPAVNFAVGTNPYSVAIGNLNGDSKPDLAVTNINSNNVSILLNSGAGAFGCVTTFAAGMGPSSVAVGDLNGDGKLDLAVANQGNNTVSILLNGATPSSTTKLYEFVGTANGVNGAWCLREPSCFEAKDLNVPGASTMADLTTKIVASVNALPCGNSLAATVLGPASNGQFKITVDTCGGTLQFRVGHGGAASCDALSVVAPNGDVGVPAQYNPDVYEIPLSGMDCNDNGEDDLVDILDGTSQDCSANGIADECEADVDSDGIIDDCDNCPTVSNPIQADIDGDSLGNDCDADMDGDGVLNGRDNCKGRWNPGQADQDGDRKGDVCDICPFGPLSCSVPLDPL
jgi:hypothetical protein